MKVELALQDRTTASVGTLIDLWVLEVALVGPQGEAIYVDLEDCKTALAGCKIIPTGSKVGPVRVDLASHIHTLAGSKVVPGRVVLLGQKLILAETKVVLFRVSLFN